MLDVTAVVLGGGRGTRLFPLTKLRSKPAVPLGGKYRLIDVTVSNCINSKIERIYVLTQFNSASLNQHVSLTYRFDSFSDGFVEILAAEQTYASSNWFQGTADAVRQTLPHLENHPYRDVLVLSGDHLYRMDYRHFILEHRRTGADITIAVRPVPASKGHEFGILRANTRGRITEFREKPRGHGLTEMKTDTGKLGLSATEARKRPYLGSMGIYLFKYEALKKTLGEEEAHVVDFARELIPGALKGFKVQAYLYDGYWEDIGTIGAFYRAHRDLVTAVPKFNLFDTNFPIYTHPRFLPGIKVNRGEIERSILNDGGIIENSVIKRSVIGVRSRIGARTSIEDSLVMGADYFDETEICGKKMPPVGIGKGCRIRKAIIDKNVRIGDRVILENRKKLRSYDDPLERFYIRNGIIVVVKGAVIEGGFVV